MNGFFVHLILGHGLSICRQNQVEVETKYVIVLVLEPLTTEAREGKPQPTEKMTEKIWARSVQPVQGTRKEGQWEDKERY
jgi:hypothetical protein